jgi:plastocyanin
MRPRFIAPPLAVAVVVAAIALLAAPSRPSSTASGPATVVKGARTKLTIKGYAFMPAALTVKAGTVITVTNQDATAHTATAMHGDFDSGTVAPGKTISFTVRTPGTYSYYCQFHAFMTGTIKVLP